MTTNGKFQNISIQPTKLARTPKTIYELPRENLTEAELVRKSTSDRTKRRVAHKAWFPLPVITKPVMTENPQRKPNKKLVLKKHGLSRKNLTKAELVRKSTSDRTKCRVTPKASFPLPVITKPVVTENPQRKPNKKLVLKKDGSIWRVKKPCKVLDSAKAPHSQSSISGITGVDDRIKADKRKSVESKHCDEAVNKKQKKNNVDTSKAEKKSRSHKA
eukprot:XP_003240238.1 PREDICTED: uncharacterized protein LOC100575895 [Acyrthosiphon pisum]